VKVAFISDIHGNAIALEAVIADIKKRKVDQLFVLGDICYRGPEPKRSLSLVQSLNTKVIKGNADEWVVRGVREGEVPEQVLEKMNLERDWIKAQLDQNDLHYLETLPTEINVEVGGAVIQAFHATPESLFDVVLPNAEDDVIATTLMTSEQAQVFVYAHIHKPYIRYINGKIIMNIGSVGLPFDGLAKASYGMVEITNGEINTSIQRVGFDVEKVVEKYREVDYPNADMMINVVRNGRL